MVIFQEISNRTTERTPKPEYLIARSQLRGPLGFGPIHFFDGAMRCIRICLMASERSNGWWKTVVEIM